MANNGYHPSLCAASCYTNLYSCVNGAYLTASCQKPSLYLDYQNPYLTASCQTLDTSSGYYYRVLPDPPEKLKLTELMTSIEKLEGQDRINFLKENLVGINVNGIGSNGKTLLMQAVSNSDDKTNLSMINILVDAGADINMTTYNDMCAFGLALHYNPQNLHTIKLLIEKGADLSHRKYDKSMALTLIEIGLDPTLLIFTTIDDGDFLKMLVEKGANVNALNHRSESILSLILEKKKCQNICEIILLLQKYGADMDQMTPYNSKSILMKMAEFQEPAVINILYDFLQQNLFKNLHEKDASGANALHYAIHNKGPNINVLRYLLEAGVELDTSPGTKFIIKFQENEKIFEYYDNDKYLLLIEYGIDVYHKDRYDNSFLMNIINTSNYDSHLCIVKMLLEKFDFDLNTGNAEGYSYLTSAMKNDNIHIAILLLNYGADYKKMYLEYNYTRTCNKSFLSYIDFNNESHEVLWNIIEKISLRKFTMKTILGQIVAMKDEYTMRPSSLTPQMIAIKWRLMQDPAPKVFEELQTFNPSLLQYMGIDRADILAYKVEDCLNYI